MNAETALGTLAAFVPQPSPPPTTHSTSQAAMQSIVPILPKLQASVLQHIARMHARGATCDEVEQALGLSHQTASARVHELAKAKRIVGVGKRPTRSGRNAVVWVVPLRKLKGDEHATATQ